MVPGALVGLPRGYRGRGSGGGHLDSSPANRFQQALQPHTHFSHCHVGPVLGQGWYITVNNRLLHVDHTSVVMVAPLSR